MNRSCSASVRERARAFQVDEDALLRVCLHATRLGLWNQAGTSCVRTAAVSANRTAVWVTWVRKAREVCLIDFGTDSAMQSRSRFMSILRSARVPLRTFCSAEPATKEHIRRQHSVPRWQADSCRRFPKRTPIGCAGKDTSATATWMWGVPSGA